MKLAGLPCLIAGFVLIGAFAGSHVVLAQAPAAMQIGATVAPSCSISVGETAAPDDSSPAVRVTCGRRALRALRVTTEGTPLHAVPSLVAARELRAGGEVVFVIPNVVATVASLTPFLPAPAAAPPAVVVTLDF